MGPTTLNRNLKPLVAKGLVRNAADSADGRVRVVRITEKGRRALLKAVPFWQDAQARSIRRSVLGQSQSSMSCLIPQLRAYGP